MTTRSDTATREAQHITDDAWERMEFDMTRDEAEEWASRSSLMVVTVEAWQAATAAASAEKMVVVRMPDGSSVCAPCAIDGCQYTAATQRAERLEAALRALGFAANGYVDADAGHTEQLRALLVDALDDARAALRSTTETQP